MTTLQSWTTTAVNLAEHADNPIHTDAGARAAGFHGALVAGTTVYAYVTHPPAAAWGRRWIDLGGGEVWFKRPVMDDAAVTCAVVASAHGETIEAQVEGEAKVVFVPTLSPPAMPERDGDRLEPFVLAVADGWADYGTRSGDDLSVYVDDGIVHPAAWPSIANGVFKRYLVDGPWIHTRSRIAHLGVARADEVVEVRSTVVDRFDSRAGERAIVDVRIVGEQGAIAAIEHEAIVRVAA